MNEMKLSNNEKIKFHYGVAFEERLLSGYVTYGEKLGCVYYELTHKAGDLKGEFPIAERTEEIFLRLLDLPDSNGISNSYEGGWDDLGSSNIAFCLRGDLLAVRVNEVYDRKLLKNGNEKILFTAIDEFNFLVNEIYKQKGADA